MSPAERKLIDFVASRLESMLRHPAIWGTDLAVEEKVLQLLEMRRLLLDPAAVPSNNTNSLMQSYARFLAREIPEATAEPLAIQLEQAGRSLELGHVLGKFVEFELTEYVTQLRQPSGGEPAAADAAATTDFAITSRLLHLLKAQAAAEQARGARHKHTPVVFPEQEDHG